VQLHAATLSLYYLNRVKGKIQALGADEDRDEGSADEWESARDTAYHEQGDMWIGRIIVVLVRGLVYGTKLIYDVDDGKYYLNDDKMRPRTIR
jgi:hypothetical protein